MKRESKDLTISIVLLIGFFIWTALVQMYDVRAIGPQESVVGFATMNAWFHQLTDVNMYLYNLTDWLSVLPLLLILLFAFIGLYQWVSRKCIIYVDFDLLILGAFYIVVLTIFALFEILVINFRPVLINDILEASYPSSTTMLVMCVMPTTIVQIKWRIKHNPSRVLLVAVSAMYMVFMVLARMVSGVHWLSDIIGGALISASLVYGYCLACKLHK